MALPVAPARARTIEFAGLMWHVRSTHGGPGPNFFSDSPENVWVDGQGHLHLKIRKIDDTWHCAEVLTERSFGYAEYRFVVEGDVAQLQPSVVLGLFTYLDDLHEIDIEMARWGNPSDELGQYVVQPYYTTGNLDRFPVSLSGASSTHLFRWFPNQVAFQSYQGDAPTLTDPGDLIHQWTYAGGDIPEPSTERVHINLWLFQSQPPADEQEVEVVIRSVTVLQADVPASSRALLALMGALLALGGAAVASRRLKLAER